MQMAKPTTLGNLSAFPSARRAQDASPARRGALARLVEAAQVRGDDPYYMLRRFAWRIEALEEALEDRSAS